MSREEFVNAVLSSLRRATADERAAIRQELEEHLEDHMDAGCPEAEAVAAMGDPAAIGQALDRQFSPGWLWLGRAAAFLTVILCIQMLFGLGYSMANLKARIYPDMESHLETVEATGRVNIKAEIGDDVIRVFRVSIGEHDGKRIAEVSMCAYDRWPFGIVEDNLINKGELKVGIVGEDILVKTHELQDSDEKIMQHFGGGAVYGRSAVYRQSYVPIELEDSCLVWEYRRFKNFLRLMIYLEDISWK